MPFIGFGDDPNTKKKELSEEEIEQQTLEYQEKEETEVEEQITLPRKMLEKLYETYSKVVVNDFGDDYHKSPEELEKENELFKYYRLIDGKKDRFRELPKYIEATRNCLQFLYAVAERQPMYTKEEFLELWATKKIKVHGMYLPKYIGKDRKRVNGEYIAEYILSGKPANEVFGNTDDMPMITDEESLYQEQMRFFGEEGLRDLIRMAYEENLAYEEGDDEEWVDEDDPKTYLGKPYAIPKERKEMKKLMKQIPGLAITMKESTKSARGNAGFRDEMVYDAEFDDLKELHKYEKLYGIKPDTLPDFEGSIMCSDDVDDYAHMVDEYRWKHERVNYNGKDYTLEEVNELRLKEVLERGGFNIRMLRQTSEKDEKLDKVLKKERKNREYLRNKLTLWEKERKDRKFTSVKEFKEAKKKIEAQARDATEKQGKKGKNGKGKKGKKKSKEEKMTKKAIQRKKEYLDEVLLGTAGVDKENFDEYESEALDWTYEKMMEGSRNED